MQEQINKKDSLILKIRTLRTEAKPTAPLGWLIVVEVMWQSNLKIWKDVQLLKKTHLLNSREAVISLIGVKAFKP